MIRGARGNMRRGTTIRQGDLGAARDRCRLRRHKALTVVALTGALLAACGTTITKHGHQFQDTDLQQIRPGLSQEQVRMTLGTPTTTAS
ncbi:MAG TPA: outer membrane protein assembly factor BamE, partial [Hyphomicrobiaceae bacterium]|nr:outer membrane protein assembly factor BamE [Hyphomicrobiaceae bacterium]